LKIKIFSNIIMAKKFYPKGKTAMRRPRKGGRRLGAVGSAVGGAVALYNGIKYGRRVLQKYQKIRKMNQRVLNDGNGSSFSTFMKSNRGYKIKGLKSGPVSQYVKTETFQLTTSGYDNLQAIINVSNSAQTDLQGITSQIQTLHQTSSTSPAFLYGSVGTTGGMVNTVRYFLQSAVQDIWYTNQVNTNVILVIYDIETRIEDGPLPVAAWRDGMKDAGSSPSDTLYQIPYNTPFMSPLFCSYYKVNKIHTIELAQGRSHRHRTITNHNRVINTERLNNSTAFRGITRFSMSVAYGLPCDAVLDGTQVNLSPVKLDMVVNTCYKWKEIDLPVTNYFRSAALTSTNANQNIMDIGSGLVSAIAQA